MQSNEEEVRSTFDEVLGSIDRGIAGGNEGIPIHFPRLRKYLPNIQLKTFYLLGAAQKIGKTSISDDIFLYGAYDWYKANKDAGTLNGVELDIDYYSFEIDKISKILKGISRKMWHDYGLTVDANTILSKGENRCPQEIYDLVLGYRSYFDEMEDVVSMHTEPENVTGMRKYLVDKASKNGEIVYKNINKDPEGAKILRFDKYIPRNPKRYWEIIIDHAALIKEESGMNLKQSMDAMSGVMRMARNNFSAIPIVIQQMSSEMENDERFKSGRLAPTLRDYADSRYLSRDANVIIALFSPYRAQLEKFQGYNVLALQDSFRNLEILVNRDGEPNINVGLNFIGPCGTFRELPKASEMTADIETQAKNYTNNRSTFVRDENNIWIPNPNLQV